MVKFNFCRTLLSFFCHRKGRKKPSTWLLVNHSSLVNSRLFCASLALRIWLETYRGSALRPVCSLRSNFAVKHFFTLSVNVECPALGLTNAQPIQTVGSNGHRSCSEMVGKLLTHPGSEHSKKCSWLCLLSSELADRGS